jgi:hypothetical protein
MPSEVMAAGDATRLIRRLEQNLEMPIAVIVCVSGAAEFSFLFPAEANPRYVRFMLERVADACQNASKSL